jgi:hypothetical protein
MSGQSLIPEDEPSSKALEEERSPNPVIKSSILETLALCIDVHVLGTSHRRAPKGGSTLSICSVLFSSLIKTTFIPHYV